MFVIIRDAKASSEESTFWRENWRQRKATACDELLVTLPLVRLNREEHAQTCLLPAKALEAITEWG